MPVCIAQFDVTLHAQTGLGAYCYIIFSNYWLDSKWYSQTKSALIYLARSAVLCKPEAWFDWTYIRCTLDVYTIYIQTVSPQ